MCVLCSECGIQDTFKSATMVETFNQPLKVGKQCNGCNVRRLSFEGFLGRTAI